MSCCLLVWLIRPVGGWRLEEFDVMLPPCLVDTPSRWLETGGV